MKSPLVSIIIPCYNDAEFIEKAVNSALMQTYPFKEVIVIDDGSDKKTKDVLKIIDSKITKLITQENQGQSKARNVGISYAKGEYILTLDSDDYFEPSFCEEAIHYIKEDEVKLVTCYANLIYRNKKKLVYKPKGGTIDNFMFSNCALGTSLFKKKDWETINGYDEKMRQGWEDWEFFIRLLKSEGKCVVIEKPLFNYVKRDNTTTSRANSTKYSLLKYILTKHQDLYSKNYAETINFLIDRIEKNENEAKKNKKSIENKIGNGLLKFPRFIKQKIWRKK